MSTFEPFEALLASAGSGKTFSLVSRYISLLFKDQSADEILALTFTNKAANEMQERIVQTLLKLESRQELDLIVSLTGLTKEQVLLKKAEVLDRFLRSDTKIMTIDSFFTKIVRKFALNASLMPDFSISSAQHEAKVIERFLKLCTIESESSRLVEFSILSSKRFGSIFKLLNELYVKEPEIRELEFEQVDISQHIKKIVILHKQMRDLFQGKKLSARAAKTLEATTVEELLKKSWIAKESMEYWDYKRVFESSMDDVLFKLQDEIALYMRAKEQLYLYHLKRLLDVYKSAKLMVAKDENELAFDDVNAVVYYLLKECIDRDFLYFRLDARVSHLLLDEFQDTSILQFDILRPIVDEIVSGGGVHDSRSLFLVGDTKQSIYRFRGGAKELFGEVVHRYGLHQDSLKINYRSSKNIVTFVNEVFRLKIDGYIDQIPKSEAKSGYVEVVESEDLLDSVKETVLRVLELGAKTDEIAILCSTNADILSVQEYLHADAIATSTQASKALINQKRVRALIAYVKYCYLKEPIYRYNFCALSDIPIQDIEPIDISNKTLQSLLKESVQKYRLFSDDIDILLFLEAVSRFSDIEEFLFTYERLEQNAASAQSDGVQLLTVHKSKGLEFEHVIVLDRLSRPRADRSAIIYEYESTTLRSLRLRQSGRDQFDSEYREILQGEARLRESDEINALYVAFTRAEKTLFVLKKTTSSKFDILDIDELEFGVLQTQHQDRSTDMPLKKIEYKALELGKQEGVLREDREICFDNFAAKSYGTVMHYVLEMMSDFDESSLKDALIVAANRYAQTVEPAAFESIEKRVERLVRFDEFLQLLDGEIVKEQPFSFDKKLYYIDLLIKRADEWIVVDYKSSLFDAQKHQNQVEKYMSAVEMIAGVKTSGYICYILEKEVKIVKV